MNSRRAIGSVAPRGDLADVRAVLDAGLVTTQGLRAAYTEAEPYLYRYPAVDVESYRRALDEVTAYGS